MTTLKYFEIRDKGTFIPALAVEVAGSHSWLARRAGFGDPMIVLIHLTGMRCHYDPYEWGDRTMRTAHDHIANTWEAQQSGAVIDVEFILGESDTKKLSEAGL